MDFLNSKQKKLWFKQLEDEYGYSGPTDMVVWTPGNDKFYVVTRSIDEIPFQDMRIKHAGLYVANNQSGELRLTMDGAMLFGPHCVKQHAITDSQKDQWMKGENIAYDGEEEGFLIITFDDKILGCGRVRDTEILNYVPKSRRIHEPHDYS